MKQRKKQVGARWIAKVRGVIGQVQWAKRQPQAFRAAAASKGC
jgi:hypothetical protein